MKNSHNRHDKSFHGHCRVSNVVPVAIFVLTHIGGGCFASKGLAQVSG